MTTREKPKLPAELTPIVADLIKAGAKPYLVGGAVRDWLRGESPKDHDIEVYKMDPEALVTALSKFGRVDKVGVSFGVIKLKTKNGTELDFSLPRRESKAGVGHKGFIVKPDPSMTVEEACGRRDYTINAMAYDLSEDKLLDFFKGVEHLSSGTLRHTTAAFAEDPLRVLRGFQFAGRFNMTIDPETAEFCKGLRGEFKTLATERVWGEWEKWALKSTVPGAGIRFLVDTTWHKHFELNYLDPPIRPDNAADAALKLSTPENRLLLTIGSVMFDAGGSWDPRQNFLNSIGAPNYVKTPLLSIASASRGLYDPERLLTNGSIRKLSVDIAHIYGSYA